jgi:hypothetical protein
VLPAAGTTLASSLVTAPSGPPNPNPVPPSALSQPSITPVRMGPLQSTPNCLSSQRGRICHQMPGFTRRITTVFPESGARYYIGQLPLLIIPVSCSFLNSAPPACFIDHGKSEGGQKAVGRRKWKWERQWERRPLPVHCCRWARKRWTAYKPPGLGRKWFALPSPVPVAVAGRVPV